MKYSFHDFNISLSCNQSTKFDVLNHERMQKVKHCNWTKELLISGKGSYIESESYCSRK